MTITEQGLSIAQVAELVGVSAHALRYYEREGLLRNPIERASSSHRRYTEADVNWVRFVTKLRSTAMPIARIKEYAALARQGDATRQARLDLLLVHRMSVVAQLEEMTKSLAAIDYKIATYEERTAQQ
ncbi:MerR family transcriptional regulator [Herbiconiux daphne]|uniref:MerR family transcriptional regulator n=1 Tax=Herbiconiux daphne TaxID=2970914 RepID=A0ABT2H126_9MICO|nr:MerR family transcriptional regulator [Herbiconiux daphne]MCS5733636.1 MerR family transcriptional regulator [Herbiconiux daphne]